MSDSEARDQFDIDPLDDAEGDDLFGDANDDSNDDANDDASDGASDGAPEPRVLAEEELASDPEADDSDGNLDDDGQLPYSQGQTQDDQMQEIRQKVIMGVTIYRHRIPKPKDKVLRTLRIPPFLKVIPDGYDSSTFEPTQFDIDNARSQQSKRTIRFTGSRRDQMRSNANVYRWADGSVTLSVGEEHYELQRKSLGTAPDQPYSEVADAHCYAAAAEINSDLLVIVGHIGEQYSVRPPKGVEDSAQITLRERMAEAMQTKGTEMNFKLRGNPELERQKADQAEKERMRAERRREAAQARALEAGIGRAARSLLGVNDLEAGAGRRGVGAAGGKRRGVPGAGKSKKRRPEYDSDDDLPQGARRQEAYDLEDDFIAPSDEESAGGADDDDDDEEDDVLDDEEESQPRPKRQRTAQPEDEDAEGEEDDSGPAVTEARARRRRVIEDEEDDD